MNDARHELIDYLALQFPATVGHIPLAAKIDEIRRQALLEAAEIANQSIAHELDCDWVESKNQKPCSCGIGMITTGIYDAILARAKEVEAQPHSTDEKKI